MLASILNASTVAILMTASSAQSESTSASIGTPSYSDLSNTLGASDFAEIYLVRRDLFTTYRMRPDGVRELGCKYLVRRSSPAWVDLERTLVGARVRVSPSTQVGEVRVGLVLGNEAGTLLEIYSNDRSAAGANMTGLSQQRRVEISATFEIALRSFAARHPDLALSNSGPVPRCPGRLPQSSR